MVVCDIANKYELADECDPAAFVGIDGEIHSPGDRFFLKAGAYIEAADGEGVVAIFGFPKANRDHAEKAVRVALELVDEFFGEPAKQRRVAGECDVHVGVSSGTMIVAPLQRMEINRLLASGEPVELARRFCVANRSMVRAF